MRNSSYSDIEVEDEDTGIVYVVSFDFTAWSTPAKIYGDPSDCYPEDYGYDYDITGITVDGKKVLEKGLSDSVVDKIHSEVDDWVAENGLENGYDESDCDLEREDFEYYNDEY